MADQIIVVKTLIRTGERSPSQWEAETSDGRRLHVRYRWGLLEIGVGQSVADAVEHSGNLFENRLGHKLDGSMELEELREATKGLIEWPNAYENHPAEFQAVDFTPAAIAGLEIVAGEREEKAKKEGEPTATHLREEAKVYRDWIAALKTRTQMS